MMKFGRDYFELSPIDYSEVEQYATFNSALAGSPQDERYYAALYQGLPLSNAFYIHEREEIRVLRRLGLDPLAPDIRDVLEGNLDTYGQAHSNGIRSEFHCYKMLTEQSGVNIPVPVLILFAPTTDPINRYDYLSWYGRLNHDNLVRGLYKFSTTRLAKRITGLSTELIPLDTQMEARSFYRGLIRNEPGWRNIYIVQ